MQKQTTLKDVAKRAGVSFQTVSKVLNKNATVSPETEKRIWQAIEELNYHPNFTARSLRVQRTRTIGYSWLPSQPGRFNPILDDFLQSMFRVADEQGYYFLCFPYHEDPEQTVSSYRDLVSTRRVDGFVLSTVNYEDPSAQYLLDNKIPFYAFGRSAGSQSFPYIDVDGAEGLRLATHHLASLGHQRLGVLAWPEDSRVGNNRMDGFLQGLDETGLSLEKKRVYRGEGTYEHGYAGMNALLSLSKTLRPSAVLCMNDEMAFGAMDCLSEHKLLAGKDLGIVGFDDVPAARLSKPSLTSLRQPVDRVGTTIMQRLINWLETDTPPEPKQELMLPELIVRESTQPN